MTEKTVCAILSIDFGVRKRAFPKGTSHGIGRTGYVPFGVKRGTGMIIGLIADDTRKTLMQNLCIAYKGILGKHELYSTGVTGRMIEEATNLHVHKFLAGSLGGEQQLAMMIEQNQIDMVIFLRNADKTINYDVQFNYVVPLCDEYSIPLATNIATAEMLLKGMNNGDLEWRNLYK